MTSRSRYWQFCAFSGILWGLIGLALGRPQFKDVLWSVWIVTLLIVSPLIGLIVGALARPWIRARLPGLAVGALVNLYLAVALYGFALTLYSWCVGDAPRGEPFGFALDRAWESAIGAAIGVTITGYVLFLWPLAAVNHRWLARWR